MPRKKYKYENEPFRNYLITCPHCKEKIQAWEDDAICYKCGKPICPECLFPIGKWRHFSGGSPNGNWYRVECPRCEYAIIDY